MNLLLDTHVIIWAFTNEPSLSPEAREAIVDGRNLVFASAVSAWEITIKKSLGKLRAPDNYLEEVRAHAFTTLDITTEHALEVGKLPPHHPDPFDRLLIAQARHEGLTLVSRDANVHRYDVRTIVA